MGVEPTDVMEAADSAARIEELRQRLRSGESSVLADLYDGYAHRIHGLALWWMGNREEAEDVVQETFVRVWEKRHLVARARDLEAYLLRMAKTIAAGRSRRRRPTEPLEAAALVLAVDAEADRGIEAARLSRHLRALTPKLRAAVYLHAFLGYSFRKSGAVLGVPTFTVASRYRLALAKLREMMEA